MLYSFIGFLSVFCLCFGYFFIHPKAKIKRPYVFYFLLITITSMYAIHPYQSLWLWLGLTLFLYLCLEDFSEKGISVFIPIWLSLCFYFFDRNPYFLLWSTAYFLIFLFLDWLWDKFMKRLRNKHVSENFDILFLFPLLYLIFFENPAWIAYVIFVFLVLLSRITKGSIIGEGDAWFLLPLFYLFEPSAYLPAFIMSLILAMPFSFYHLSVVKEKDFPYTPFIFGGFLVVHLENAFVSIGVLAISLLSFLLLYIISLFKKKKIEG